MSKIITFANQKGGSGKTTLSVMVANALSSAPFNHSVVVVDCDDQQSITRARLYDLEEHKGLIPYDVKTWNIPTLQNRIQDLDKECDFLIIDLAGRLGKDIETMLAYIDFCFVPIVSGNYNLESSLSFLKYINKLSSNRKNPLLTYGVLNRFQASRVNSKFLSEEAGQIKDVYGVPFMRSKVRDYVTYQDIDTINTLYNENAKDSPGINFKLFFDEFYQLVNQ